MVNGERRAMHQRAQPSHGVVRLDVHLRLDPGEGREPRQIESLEAEYGAHAAPALAAIPALARLLLQLLDARLVVPDRLHLVGEHDAGEDGKQQPLEHQTYQQNDIQRRRCGHRVASLRVDVGRATCCGEKE